VLRYRVTSAIIFPTQIPPRNH